MGDTDGKSKTKLVRAAKKGDKLSRSGTAKLMGEFSQEAASPKMQLMMRKREIPYKVAPKKATKVSSSDTASKKLKQRDPRESYVSKPMKRKKR